MKNWKIGEFVLIGLLAAIYGAVTLGIGMITAMIHPLLHLFSPAIVSVLMGTVVLFVIKKVEKFGALSLFIGVGICLFAGLSGMMYVPLILTVILTSLLAEAAAYKLHYNIPAVAIGYGLIQAAYIFGGCIPVLFFLEQNMQHWKDAGMDAQTIEGFVRHSTGWFLVLGMTVSFTGGIVGVLLGKLILKKHFKDLR